MNAMIQPTDLDIAAQNLRECKVTEDAARRARIAAEEAVLAIAGCKSEGSTTTKTAFFKVTTTGKLTRSIEPDTWEAVKSEIPEAIRDRLVRYKPDLVLSELRYIESDEPEIYAVFAQALTIKPAKASVSVDVL